jgi:broad specificity phosphatase PhoE
MREAFPVTGVTVWYIRHGHNPANQTAELSYRVTDYPLTELGVTQATTLAGQLARRPAIAAIYASPLRRATQTAEIIAERIGGTVHIIEELREFNVGELDGRSDEQAWARYHQVLDDWRAGHHDTAFPGGENYLQMTARLASAFLHALRHPMGSHVLFIGHGGIIRAAIPALCPGAPVPAVDLPNCGMAELLLRPAPRGVTGALSRWPFTLPEQRPGDGFGP